MPATGKGRYPSSETTRATAYSNSQSAGVSPYKYRGPQNTYRDSRGTEHAVSTETGEINRESMESLRYTVVDGGDTSNCSYKVIGAPTSWPAEQKV